MMSPELGDAASHREPVRSHSSPFLPSGRPTILVADQDADLRRSMGEFLERHGYEVFYAQTLAEAEAENDDILPDLVVSGAVGALGPIDVCQRLAGRFARPIVLLSADADRTERILALESGADDLLPRPCDNRELLARIRSVLRRRAPEGGIRSASCEWIFRKKLRTLTSPEGVALNLTPCQAAVIEHFATSPGEPASPKLFIGQIVGLRSTDDPSNSFRTVISRLRRRLERTGVDARVITSVRGRGYRFNAKLRSV